MQLADAHPTISWYTGISVGHAPSSPRRRGTCSRWCIRQLHSCWIWDARHTQTVSDLARHAYYTATYNKHSSQVSSVCITSPQSRYKRIRNRWQGSSNHVSSILPEQLYQWTITREVIRSDWGQRLGSATGVSDWGQRLGSATRFRDRGQQLGSATGVSDWVQRLGSATGVSDRDQRLGSATKFRDWGQQLGSATGVSDWGQQLGSETGVSNWGQRLGVSDWGQRPGSAFSDNPFCIWLVKLQRKQPCFLYSIHFIAMNVGCK